MANKITTEQRKLLTEWLGEKWHWIKDDATIMCECGERWYVRNVDLDAHENRTFDNWTDFGAVVEKLIKTEQWEDFFSYAYLRLYRNTGILIEKGVGVLISDPERFCILAAEAIKEGVIK